MTQKMQPEFPESFEVTPQTGQALVKIAEEKLAQLPVVSKIAKTLEVAHYPSYEHCLRVGEIAYRLAGVDGFTCGVLHDIGKSHVGIPEILDIPSKLNAEQMALVRSHEIHGAELISQQIIDTTEITEQRILARAAFVARYHHMTYKELQQLRLSEDMAAPDVDIYINELIYRKRLTQTIHLIDQVDARTDVSRPYLLSSQARGNIGVRQFGEGLQVLPIELWADITGSFFDRPDEYTDSLFAQRVFTSRFGGRLSVANR